MLGVAAGVSTGEVNGSVLGGEPWCAMRAAASSLETATATATRLAGLKRRRLAVADLLFTTASKGGLVVEWLTSCSTAKEVPAAGVVVRVGIVAAEWPVVSGDSS